MRVKNGDDMKKILFYLFCILIFNAFINATIINIPTDEPTIQQGIDIAAANDTILIADGTYNENLQIIGKEIMLASWFIIDADSSHIDNTIIDGSLYTNADEASVIVFFPGANPNAVPRIIGLTLINGSGRKIIQTIEGEPVEKKVGGGLYIQNLNPVFSHNAIKNNAVEDEGGGGYVLNCNPNFGGLIEFEGNWNWERAINPGGNVFSNNYASLGKTFFNKTATSNDTIFAENCIFDVYSTSDSDISEYWATSQGEFSFANSIGEDEAIITDVYVSLTGNDSLNTGLSPASPFQHIWYALSQVYADSLNPITIHLAAGTYSPSTNGEQFMLQIPDYVTLIGDDTREETILDAEGSDRVIVLWYVKEANIESMTIMNGNADYGGGILCAKSTGTLINLIVKNNQANYKGGGIHCAGSNTMISLNNVEVTNNSSYKGGGGIGISTCDPVLENVTVSYNSAFVGGGILCGPIYTNPVGSNPYLKNVLISNNTDLGYNPYSDLPVSGAGMYIASSNPILENVTITNNITDPALPWVFGGAVFCGYLLNSGQSVSNPIILNSIISNQIGGVGIYVSTQQDPPSSPDISFSDFYNNEEGNFGGNIDPNLGVNVTVNANGDSCDIYYNIQLDPVYFDEDSSDFHLIEFSPCIDAGNPTSPYDPDGTISDMGMYYFHQTPPDTPENVIIVVLSDSVFISWDEVNGALSYSVWSDQNPYGSFATEVWTGISTNWCETITEEKKFYRITANN